MELQHGTVQGQSTPTNLERGISMFKDHVAAMKSGSKLLGGEESYRGTGKDHSTESE